ncbi:MAG TPA: hypothetical protein VLE49_04555 [Anaerolineales bacterium]|nr:hypothetical protein [Anaerolineales bacterium]
MKRKIAPVLFALIVLIVSQLACNASASTANINNAWMDTTEEGKNPATVFSQDAVFFAFVDLKNAPDDTKLKAVWTAVDAQDTEKNLKLNETEFVSSDGLVHFQLENKEYLWPVGQYKVDIYLNDKLDKTLTFEVR